MRLAALALCSSLALACDRSDSAPAPPPAAAAPAAAAEPAAVPAPEPPPLAPAPEGTVAIGRVYVHTCADPKRCPAMNQDVGLAHCHGLDLGSLSWRLPTIAELEGWRGNAALHGYDVFHWSESAWDEDPAQLWIYDPGSGHKTTARPDRKPFTIRCVASPSPR